MKKFLTILCMITCIFGLTACGDEETLSAYEQQKADTARQLAEELVMYVFVPNMTDESIAYFEEYTAEEIAYMMGNQYNINVDGYGFSTALESFNSAAAEVGTITGTNGSTAEIDGSQIIVEVEVLGEKKNAKAEVIFSNDMFFALKSAALNPESTIGELMGNAALNTLIGMGTVFAVLILISLIISGFRIIPRIQENMAKKKAPAEKSTGVDNAVAQILEQEAVEEVGEADDLELVAVIAAAIAASEGAATTDGFVVRSIRRRQCV